MYSNPILQPNTHNQVQLQSIPQLPSIAEYQLGIAKYDETAVAFVAENILCVETASSTRLNQMQTWTQEIKARWIKNLEKYEDLSNKDTQPITQILEEMDNKLTEQDVLYKELRVHHKKWKEFFEKTKSDWLDDEIIEKGVVYLKEAEETHKKIHKLQMDLQNLEEKIQEEILKKSLERED